jgi:hypothetical protein
MAGELNSVLHLKASGNVGVPFAYCTSDALPSAERDGWYVETCRGAVYD